MRILVDADACPVKKIIMNIAKNHGLKVVMFIDNCHILDENSSYEVITVDKGKDSVDLCLVNKICKDDIVITQDYGLAAIALSRLAKVVSFSGLIYTNQNIDSLLLARHTSAKIRQSGGRMSRIKKRKPDDDIAFSNSLIKLIEES